MAPHSPEHLRKMLVASLMTQKFRAGITLPSVAAVAGLDRTNKLLADRLSARKEELNDKRS